MDKINQIIIEKLIDSQIPLPLCVINSAGKIIGANEKIQEVFIYNSDLENADFFALTGVKVKDIINAANDTESNKPPIVIDRNGKKFRISIDFISESDSKDGPIDEVPTSNTDVAEKVSENFSKLIIFFHDVTDLEELKGKYEAERTCICKITVDNYEQFNDAVSPETGMTVDTEVNKLIRKWAQDLEASIDKIKESQYVVFFKRKYLDNLTAGKFELLDQVRSLETSADFPLSLSMGIGVGGENMADTAAFAASALDLAVGRGGDQAVVKDENRIQFYGGKTQSVEKSNKGKSRVVGHAIKKLMEESENVLIMGHKHADMDAFGSALGMYRMAIACKADPHIVIDEIPDSLRDFYDHVKDTQNYELISTEQAKKLVEKNALVVVLDTHRPSYLEAPELLDAAKSIVIIDHHRRAEDSIENPTLAYIESYASSTAELVTEILQYILDRKILIRLEAEALLGGMTIDTNRFAVKTGVRTFEAAAWLRRSGADTTEVKRFFQMDEETFKIKARAIASMILYPNGIAVAICEGEHQDVQVINAQVADELLDIKGVKAAFTAGKNDRGKTCISARSLGDVNVQVILEQLGGGGHLNIAGAQVDISPEEVIEKILEITGKGE